MTMRPMHPAAFEKMPDLYSIPEDGIDERKPRSPARPSTAGADTSAYPMYPGLQTPNMDRTRSSDSLPYTLNRPRKLSGTTTSPEYSLAGSRAQGPVGRRTRGLSQGNGLSYDQVDPSAWKPSYMPAQTPSLLKKQKSKTMLGDICASLPGEVLEVILEMLKQLHLERGSESCATCWLRDVCNVAVCSRKWSKAARLALYQDIQLIGPDSATHKKKFKMTQGCRMTLLRRTLRANAEIASIVRSLKVPAPEVVSGVSNAKGSAALEQYENQVAALVMACPNLERLSGPTFTYSHSFKRLFHALSTRNKLRDMNWLIEPCDSVVPPPPPQITSGSSKDCALLNNAAELQAHQEIAFLEQHRGWTKLTTLSVQCLTDATLAPETLLARTLTVLPSLQHLHLHNLPANAFNDSNLLSLPALRSLTLSNMRGISSNGLSSFATRANSRPLRKLVLRHTPLTSLPALARIFSNLRSLSNFSLIQSFPPLMPESNSFILWMMPYLASASINKLHWDITSHPDSTNAADDILARSIEAGGFPSLKTLRAPNDPEGVFQQLCRPVERIDLPSDRFRSTSISVSELGSVPSSPTKHLAKSPTTSSLPSILSAISHTNLVVARLAAQVRLDRARESSDLFQVNVTDEEGALVETFGLAGYLGTVGSDINYHLLPDEGSTDEQGGLVDVPDLYGDSGESLTTSRHGCSGSWNWREGVVADKREKERWWHTERGRWRRVEL
ncbi:hypothetical protein QQS21_006390 [Conoideocrella luteorostrata]|uniref:F-box domain-containing protein n=1 Tax=Conoideocrella luteorostrata TaxID=1105319 RepID=A0AAJ0FTH2_9HYPO|nr:hypothetical protein QQS21_006390 [Conoideocrella luteorostrata]